MAALLLCSSPGWVGVGVGVGWVLPFPLLGPFFFLCSNFPRIIYLFPGS